MSCWLWGATHTQLYPLMHYARRRMVQGSNSIVIETVFCALALLCTLLFRLLLTCVRARASLLNTRLRSTFWHVQEETTRYSESGWLLLAALFTAAPQPAANHGHHPRGVGAGGMFLASAKTSPAVIWVHGVPAGRVLRCDTNTRLLFLLTTTATGCWWTQQQQQGFGGWHWHWLMPSRPGGPWRQAGAIADGEGGRF